MGAYCLKLPPTVAAAATAAAAAAAAAGASKHDDRQGGGDLQQQQQQQQQRARLGAGLGAGLAKLEAARDGVDVAGFRLVMEDYALSQPSLESVYLDIQKR